MPLENTYAQKFADKTRRLTSLAEDLPIDDAPFRQRLHLLFSQIEKEFELVFLENLSCKFYIIGYSYSFLFCIMISLLISQFAFYFISPHSTRATVQEKIDSLVAGGGGGGGVNIGAGGNRESSAAERFASQQELETDIVSSKTKQKVGISTPGSSKIKASHKLKAQTSRIVSSFKTPSIVGPNCREFDKHKDGVWQVATKPGHKIIGTASADHSACIWSAESSRCLLQYQGHSGSVNSIKFHQGKDLVLTGSGDSTAHIWQAGKYAEPFILAFLLFFFRYDSNRVDRL